MHQIRYYIDAAKRRLRIGSDRELGRHLELSPAAISHIRTGRVFPSDEVIVRIAELGGQDPKEALLTLSVRRSRGRTRELWAEIMTTAARLPHHAAAMDKDRLEHA